jgi:predicted Zn-dependent protease
VCLPECFGNFQSKKNFYSAKKMTNKEYEEYKKETEQNEAKRIASIITEIEEATDRKIQSIELSKCDVIFPQKINFA